MKMIAKKTELVIIIALVLGVSVTHAVAAPSDDSPAEGVSEREGIVAEDSSNESEQQTADSDAAQQGDEERSTGGAKEKPWMQETADDVDVPWERMIFGLFFVIVLVCLGVYLLKKFGGARFGNGQYMNVLETVPLGTDKSLALIRIGERVILLAVQKENMEKVAEFAAEDMPEPEELDSESQPGFSGILDGLMKGQK